MPKCEFCGSRKGVKLIDLGEMTYICRDCLESEYMQCDRCGGWNDPHLTKYYYLQSGEDVCQDCYDPSKDIIVREYFKKL